jgi:site-specific DNA-methyltransferase (adenine-specific)
MIQLLLGDCRDRLKELPDNSIDSIVTDPPYELGFMGKSWDASGVAYDVTVWQECLRVLKPGGHLLSFGGSRTYHRMACAIEDAGFQIRDQIMWVYGSGFPKSLNISKAIDKAAGVEREIVGELGYTNQDIRGGGYESDKAKTKDRLPAFLTAPATAEAKEWDGWGTALKPAHEPIVLARKPLDGTVANNVLKHGVGGLNIDGCRVGGQGGTKRATNPLHLGRENMTDFTKGNFGVDQLDAGRFPANFIHDGSDEVLQLFPDTKNVSKGIRGRGSDIYAGGKGFANTLAEVGQEIGYGDSGSAARFFYCAKASKKDRNEGLDGFEEKQTLGGGGLTAEIKEDGSYETASAGGKFGSVKAKQTNHHPTVKPTDLMRYLCRLVTPPNGTVLDPFTGSGSTGKAATLEGFNFIGIEQSPEYIEIAKARIESVTK